MNCKGFHHLTWNDRLTIEKMLKAGCSRKQIAAAVGVCRTTIYYELKRGKCVQITSEMEYIEKYSPEIAEAKYRAQLAAKGAPLKIGNDFAFADYVENRIIHDHYSPGAVLAEIRQQNIFETRICESTLYNYIYGGVFLYLSPEHLFYKGRCRKSERVRAARASAGESIERRPAEVRKRTTFGNWEMDSLMGGQGTSRALIVLTERQTRMGVVLPVPDHTATSVVRALNTLERSMGRKFNSVFKTITVDNGSEFQDCQGMQKSRLRRGKLRTKLYYCHPHSPNERGSNENMNRMLRRFFPKGTNFDEVSLDDIEKAVDWLNNYPRKILGWRSARQMYEEALKKIS